MNTITVRIFDAALIAGAIQSTQPWPAHAVEAVLEGVDADDHDAVLAAAIAQAEDTTHVRIEWETEEDGLRDLRVGEV